MSTNYNQIVTNYFRNEQEKLLSIPVPEVLNLVHFIQEAQLRKSMVYVAGNGGSASTASHFVTDIGVGSIRRGIPIKALCLNENTAIITAVSNDLNYESVFEQQVALLGEPGDLLILISASGNSQNLIRAAETAQKSGIIVFSLTGFDGGKLRQITFGKNVHVQTEIGSYGLVEDIHLAICHVVTECLRAI